MPRPGRSTNSSHPGEAKIEETGTRLKKEGCPSTETVESVGLRVSPGSKHPGPCTWDMCKGPSGFLGRRNLEVVGGNTQDLIHRMCIRDQWVPIT